MYGLLLSNFSKYIIDKYGENTWEEIVQAANLKHFFFDAHQVYPDYVMSQLAKSTNKIVWVKETELMEEVGVHFIQFIGQFGYGELLASLGRQFNEFLKTLNHLHDYFKNSYPKIQSPSFYCDNEDGYGLHLHYRSKRRGFAHYIIGQLKAIASTYYNTKLDVGIIEQEIKFDQICVAFKLTFDNNVSERTTKSAFIKTAEAGLLAISSEILFEVYPFMIVFDEHMNITSTGKSMDKIMPGLIGQKFIKINQVFGLVKPIIDFSFYSIVARSSSNIFDLQVLDDPDLHLKGQMLFLTDWNFVIFLCTPVMMNFDVMAEKGLFLNDMSKVDVSRDFICANSARALEKPADNDNEMQEAMKKMDEESERSIELLSQMMPRQVANQLQAGMSPVDTCQTFEQVTIVFNDIPEFGDMCSKCNPMEIVSILNTMFGIFDVLSEKHDIYKVETVKDSFVGVSGAPERVENHAERIMDMALDMRDCVTFVHDPRPEFVKQPDVHIKIRLGSHSGRIQAGIVGIKAPRYCLFGDAMNTSSRMMSFGDAQCIHISSATNDLLPDKYTTRQRGKVIVKGKGEMYTYWLDSREERKVPGKMEVMGQVIMLVMKNRGFFPKDEKVEEEERLKELFLEN